MSLYRKYPWVAWVPWESHEYGKYSFASMEMEKSMEKWLDGNEGNENATFTIFRPNQVNCL